MWKYTSIDIHDYIRMAITVLYLKISQLRGIDTVKITTLSNHKPGILNNYIRITGTGDISSLIFNLLLLY
jgi:hypothetical protein